MESPGSNYSVPQIHQVVEAFWEESEAQAGAVVVVDVATGQVLAEWPLPKEGEKKMHAPGAAFLPIMAVAALRAGVITPELELESPAEMLIDGHPMKGWNPEGWGKISLHQALVESANTYFYQLGMMTPPEEVAWTAKDLGITPPIPTPSWLKQEYPEETWSQISAANLAIGQGYVRLTPRDLATAMATIARREEGILSEKNWAALHAALQEKVARRGKQKPGAELAGFTGAVTTLGFERGKMQREMVNWFSGYLPVDQPRYALCLMIEQAKPPTNQALRMAQQLAERLAALPPAELNQPRK